MTARSLTRQELNQRGIDRSHDFRYDAEWTDCAVGMHSYIECAKCGTELGHCYHDYKLETGRASEPCKEDKVTDAEEAVEMLANIRGLQQERVAQFIDNLDASDPESSHELADTILLVVAPQAIRDAYLRLTERAEWWSHG